MSKGVLAIFGQTTLTASESIKSFTNTYKVPFISLAHPVSRIETKEKRPGHSEYINPHLDHNGFSTLGADQNQKENQYSGQTKSKFNSDESLDNYQINMHPDMGPLLISLIKYNRWKFVYYIYNHDEGF